MSAARSKVPIQSVSNDRRIDVLPAKQSPTARGFITAPLAGVTRLSCAAKTAANAHGLIGLARHSAIHFLALLVLRPGDDSNVPIC
jgi:hypothetical protein